MCAQQQVLSVAPLVGFVIQSGVPIAHECPLYKGIYSSVWIKRK